MRTPNEKLKRALELLEGYEHRIVELPGPQVRTKDVIEQVDVKPEHIVKTIVFKKREDGNVFAVALPAAERVSYKKLRRITQGRVGTLHPDELREIGWEPGECCPLTIPGPLYVDEEVLGMPTINTGSGDLHYGLEFPSKAILEVREDVDVVEIKEEKE